MYQPTLKIGKSDTLHIGEKYISNGHWLVTRELCNTHLAPKCLKNLLSLQIGSYAMGIAGGKTNDKPAELDRIIPKRDGYKIITPGPIGAEFKSENTLAAFIYETPDFKIGLAEQYATIMTFGASFAKDPLSPIIVLDSGTLNANLLAIVMPYRLDKPKTPRATPIDIAAANLVALWNEAEVNEGVDWDTLTPALDALKTAVEK